MRNRMTTLVLVAGMLALGAGLAQGAGFSIYEANSKATALGCAFTATADDGSAVFYNVAGLSFQAGQSAELNAVAVMPKFAFNGKMTTNPSEESITWESKDKTFLVPGAYYTNNPGNKLAFGVGVYAPFGLGVVWEDGDEWIGRQASHDVSIETIYVTPAASYLVNEQLALGFGLDLAHQKLELNRYTYEPQFGENAIDTEITGSSSWNVTPVLGLMYRPDDKLSFGANYHFKKTMKFDDGEAILNPVAPGNDPWGNAVVGGLGGPEQKASAELNLPDMLQLGLAYRFTPKFRAEFNYVWFGWSTFESLSLDFQNDALDQTIHFNYDDSWQIRFGLDYALTESWNLMGGYVHDRTPQPLESVSPILPDTDRNDYSFGVLYKFKTWEFNASYMYVHNEERTNIDSAGNPVRGSTTYPIGSYKAHAHLAGIGATMRF